MLTVDTLNEYGANTDEGLGRCFNNADFYLKLVSTIPAEPSFDNLKNAIDRDDLDSAFEAAHALKGVLGNLSLTPILTPIQEITELLRARTDTNYTALLDEILKQRDLLKELCN